MPSGRAVVADAPAIARIEVETWRTTYAGMLPDKVLLAMSVQRPTTPGRAFCGSGPTMCRSPRTPRARHRLRQLRRAAQQHDRLRGKIYTLYVTPDAQGTGAGRELLLGLFQRLVSLGYGSALVWVVRANPSRFFYERLGGVQVMHKPIPLGGEQVEAVAYGWRDLAAAIGRHARSGDGLAGR